MNHCRTSEVNEAQRRELFWCLAGIETAPGPVSNNGVNEYGNNELDDQVSFETCTFRQCTGINCGCCSAEYCLEDKEDWKPWIITNEHQKIRRSEQSHVASIAYDAETLQPVHGN